MAIEVRCIEHLSVEQRQSLYLLYGPLMEEWKMEE